MAFKVLFEGVKFKKETLIFVLTGVDVSFWIQTFLNGFNDLSYF